MTPRAVITDFDGTIVESVGIKDEAFRELFSGYPEHLDAIMEYHRAHNAVVRFDKFRHITEIILGERYTPQKEAELGKRFSELVRQRIIACPFVPGARDFLDFFRDKASLYLVSITPAEELTAILHARGLAGYFKDVYAVPWGKADAVNDILAREKIRREEALFIGDTQEDCDAARAAGILFLGRDSGRPFSSAGVLLYKDMTGIREYIVSKWKACAAKR